MPSAKETIGIKDSSLLSGDISNISQDEAASLIIEAEEVIQAIKNGEIEGEYFEF